MAVANLDVPVKNGFLQTALKCNKQALLEARLETRTSDYLIGDRVAGLVWLNTADETFNFVIADGTTIIKLAAGGGSGTGLVPVKTGLVGGTASDLDSIATTALTAGQVAQFVYIGNVMQVWLLEASTAATDVNAGRVRPVDYASSTNEKVWCLRL